MRFFLIFKRDFINIILNPMLLLYNTVFPILMILALGFLGRGNYGSDGITSYDYYGITILIYSVLNVSTTAANSFMEKSIKKSNLRIIYSPAGGHYIYLSKIVSTFVFTSLCNVALVFILKLILKVNFGGNMTYIIALLIVFDLLSSTIGVVFCCIFKSEEVTNRILSMANNIFAILGGLFFHVDGFGKVIERLSSVSPVKWVAKACFRIIYDNNLGGFVPTLLMCLTATLILMYVCKFIFNTEDYV